MRKLASLVAVSSVIALVAACAYVFVQGKLIGPKSDPNFSVHKINEQAKGAQNAIDLTPD